MENAAAKRFGTLKMSGPFLNITIEQCNRRGRPKIIPPHNQISPKALEFIARRFKVLAEPMRLRIPHETRPIPSPIR